MKTTRMLCVTLLWLASTSAYGEGHWSSRDPFTNEFYTRMNNYQPERFLYDSSYQALKNKQKSSSYSSIGDRFRIRWHFERRDKAKGYFYISEEGLLCVKGRFNWLF